ncbi:hypothetical protein SUGI_0225150 [Cryptomeria japonica]|nr:hypothetical protein SUGI_0225150 [Cryptomeria japonica]
MKDNAFYGGLFCNKESVDPWTPEEDKVIVEYIQKNGHATEEKAVGNVTGSQWEIAMV